MNLRTANKHKRRADFIRQAAARLVWLNTGFYLYNNFDVREPKQPGEHRLISFFRW